MNMERPDLTGVKVDLSKEDLYELYIECNKALQAIEAASYFVDDGISDWENAGRKELIQFVSDASEIAHSMLREHCCYRVHEDGRKTADIILKAADKAGYAKYEIPFKKKDKE